MRITYNQHLPSCSRFPNQISATTHLRSKTKISLHYTLKKCTLREQILILLSYPNKLSPKHIKWKLVPDFSSKHWKCTLSNCTHDLYRTLIPHRGTLYIEKIIVCTSIYCTWKSTSIFPMKKRTWEIINQFYTFPLPTIPIYL